MSWLRRLFGGKPDQAAPERPTQVAAPPVPSQAAAPPPSPVPDEPLPRSRTIIEVKRLILPDGVEAAIVEALKRGEEPDEKWTKKGRKRVYGAFFHRVVGESFENANGVSRQSVLAKAKVGSMVFFIPEPDNPADPEAIRVFLDQGGLSGEQIGYLPRSNKLKPYVASGAIAGWVARVNRREGLYGAVIYAAVKWEN